MTIFFLEYQCYYFLITFGMISIWAQRFCSIAPFLSMFQYAIDLTSLFSSNLSPFPVILQELGETSWQIISPWVSVIYCNETNYAATQSLYNNGHLLCYTASVSYKFGSSLAKWPCLAFLLRLLQNVGQGCSHQRAYQDWRVYFQDGSLTCLLAGGLSSWSRSMWISP